MRLPFPPLYASGTPNICRPSSSTASTRVPTSQRRSLRRVPTHGWGSRNSAWHGGLVKGCGPSSTCLP